MLVGEVRRGGAREPWLSTNQIACWGQVSNAGTVKKEIAFN